MIQSMGYILPWALHPLQPCPRALYRWAFRPPQKSLSLFHPKATHRALFPPSAVSMSVPRRLLMATWLTFEIPSLGSWMDRSTNSRRLSADILLMSSVFIHIHLLQMHQIVFLKTKKGWKVPQNRLSQYSGL